MVMGKREIDRRQFLKRVTMISAGVIDIPYFVRSAVLGKDGGVAPSNRITVGCIGIGCNAYQNNKSHINISYFTECKGSDNK